MERSYRPQGISASAVRVITATHGENDSGETFEEYRACDCGLRGGVKEHVSCPLDEQVLLLAVAAREVDPARIS
jgi:hypothetical protein